MAKVPAGGAQEKYILSYVVGSRNGVGREGAGESICSFSLWINHSLFPVLVKLSTIELDL